MSVSIEESVIDSILGTLYIQNQEDDILSIGKYHALELYD